MNARPGPALSAEEAACLDAAAGLLDLVADKAWPGLKGMRAAMIYVAEEGQLLLNAPSAPDYYAPYEGPAPRWSEKAWSSARWRAADGEPADAAAWSRQHIHYAYEPEQTAGHFPFPVILQDSPERALRKQPGRLEEWLTQLWHELFHVFQAGRGLRKGAAPNAVMAAAKDRETCRSYAQALSREQELLVEALEISDYRRRKELLRARYVPLRSERMAAAEPALIESELLYEAAEGTAWYLEQAAADALSRVDDTTLQAVDAPLRRDPRYGRFREGAAEAPLLPLSAETPHRFAYQTGLALCRLLEGLSPNWKREAFRGEGRLWGALRRACR